MTLRQSITLSLCIHIVLFGSAIAFAQFTGGLLRFHRDAIEVSLVSDGTSNADGDGVRQIRKDHSRVPKESMVRPVEQQAAIPSNSSSEMSEPSKDVTKDSGAGLRNETNGILEARASAGIGREGGSAAGLISAAQWAAIETAIERNKNYPRLARERAIQGVVRLRFKLAPSGDIETIEIMKSSGSEILDHASVRSVRRAAPMPYVSGWVEIPIAYVLN